MAKMIRWACPECEAETHFKGLCRECTEYDDKGRPIKPIHRIRLNHTPTTRSGQKKSKADFLAARRRKPTKKELEAIKDHINSKSKAIAHEHTEACGENCIHDEFQEIGESIGGEEE